MQFLQAAAVCLLIFAGSACAQTNSNGILREVYYNINGSAVANLTSAPKFPASPDEEFIESAFEAPANFADNYGQRMRALLVPPVTGTKSRLLRLPHGQAPASGTIKPVRNRRPGR